MASTNGGKTAQTPKEIRFNNEYDPAHRTFYVDGVIGSVNPRNYLRATFFQEFQNISSEHRHEAVAGNGGYDLGDLIADPVETVEVTRVFQATMVFNRKALADLIPWLNKHLQALQEAEANETAESLPTETGGESQ